MEPWILIAAVAGIASNINNFLNRYILRDDQDPIAYAWFYETFRTLFFIPFIFLFPLPELTLQLLIPIFVLAFLEFVSVILWMRMFAFTHLSVSAIISRARLILVPLIALAFLGESLAPLDYIGIVVLFIGLSVAVSPRKISMDRGVKYSYASAFSISFLTVSQKYVSGLASIPFLTAMMSLPSAILFPFLMKNPKKRMIRTLKTKTLLKIAASLANIVAIYLTFVALRMGPVGIVSGIYQSMMVVSIVLGITVLGEREDIGKKILGTAIALVGVLLLS